MPSESTDSVLAHPGPGIFEAGEFFPLRSNSSVLQLQSPSLYRNTSLPLGRLFTDEFWSCQVSAHQLWNPNVQNPCTLRTGVSSSSLVAEFDSREASRLRTSVLSNWLVFQIAPLRSAVYVRRMKILPFCRIVERDAFAHLHTGSQLRFATLFMYDVQIHPQKKHWVTKSGLRLGVKAEFWLDRLGLVDNP